MATISTEDLLSVTEANNLGVSGLVKRAEEGRQPVLLRNNRAVAAVIGIERLEHYQALEVDHEELEESLADVSLALARTLATGEERVSLDEVLERYGYTRDELRALDTE